MVINTAPEPVDLAKVVRDDEEWIFLVKRRDRSVDSGRKLEEERMVDKFEKTVEWELKNGKRVVRN